ncbi:MAG: chromosome segregation protein SMC [Clostridia bacterium]|nr:chromosome segregation protein SMC [Clostridia bacterium]
MHFEKIELIGFKSFADKIEIKFDDGITAIVGPNGCGKSNVGDAIRWVLGEQSSKNLRGTSMQDVIFSGTEKRRSLSYCEVSLFFNNSDRFFDIDFDELSVTRKIYRSGESEYLINKNQCRLKDIVTLFFDSGIGRDGYSIIGQGKVEEIISSKPESRRKIFEEAAGIAKFKSRKEEAERKLERTRENLNRLRDIVGEIERQLGPLKKQAETAKKYLDFKYHLKDLEVNAYIYQYENMGEVKAQLNTKMDGILEELSLRQTELVGLNQKSVDNMEKISQIDDNIKQINNEILVLTVGFEKQIGEIKLFQERIASVKDKNETIKQDISNLENSIKKYFDEKKSKEIRKNELQKNAKEIEESSPEYSDLIKNYSTLKVKAVNLISKIKEEEQNINNLNAKIQVFENRHRLLSEMQAEFEGYAYAVKKLLKESEKNVAIKNRMVGLLASLIKVPQKFETAIEVALGAAIQNIVTTDEENAKILINYLKSNQLGRATFLPISSMKPRYISHEFRNLLSTSGCHGVAAELISYDRRIKNVVENLLGSVVLTENLDIAVNIAKKSNFAFKIVTLDGDVLNPSGAMTGGSRKSQAVNLISREREISTLATDIQKAKNDYEKGQNVLNDLNEKFDEVQQKIGEIEKRKNSNEISEAVKIAEIKTEINSIENDFVRIQNQIFEIESTIKTKNQQIENNLYFIKKEETSIQDMQKNSLDTENTAKLEQLKENQEEFEQNRITLQGQLKEIDLKKEQAMQEINRINDKKFRVEMEFTKLETDAETMQQRIYEEYELTYETCLEFRREDFEIDEALSKIYELKKEISKLGYVNVNAIEDSIAICERYDEMSLQVQDLETAEADTCKIIEELSDEMSTRFLEEFEKINSNFSITFKELFGGGNAKLQLVGSDNILEAGIDIVAEPPGKKLQNITLLSGGEKALTAIAILFAIIKLKPMPFCLLDEIEAALDESNVERFAQYLRRFSNQTQFIVITHRKPTMELADSLYGVTMEEKGVSKIVSVKLNEAIIVGEQVMQENSQAAGSEG